MSMLPRFFGHAGRRGRLDAAQLVDQAVEVAEVDGLDDEVHHRAAVVGCLRAGGADVGASSEMMAVNSLSIPARSSQSTVSLTG